MKEQLINLGFSDSQARSYEILLEHRWVLPSTLAKFLGISQTGAQKILNFFSSEGLVRQRPIGKKNYYGITDLGAFEDFLARRELRALREMERQKEEGRKALQDAHLSFSQKNKDLSVFFVDGPSRLSHIETHILNCVSGDILGFSSGELKYKTLTAKSPAQRFKIIYTGPKCSLPKKGQEHFRVKDPADLPQNTVEVLLFPDKVIFVLDEQDRNLVLLDPSVVETLRCLFSLALSSSRVVKL
ncbi:MAG: hypothetical protein G01um101418_183 [Parcubacteria group bacterium Gr01-1014_18]|nr:MAG: hypothetical protein Greene041636_151 [Parcubacteria group bacterium Greene0416_36]TSC81343.1 MAG: hypothetical protein G01um101418_183 [Parcubacteria group bacterium Gr01-1014_18]TSC99471.1 MAG: hypothetical protein Greene101420_138 [Parcubacteria group bacterium Greene1014_20]TSD07610.1 MAG: hypothetical protein Greene07142_67 [Parcubacteria group bacterium Greene0714_2]